ncbi:MAG TPA: M43 family zinc metalloprotease, partial [Chitinophagaceae bacterium]|nr:M43 family zinc metalloprotease [Chitinophagaceae bacterium]
FFLAVPYAGAQQVKLPFPGKALTDPATGLTCATDVLLGQRRGDKRLQAAEERMNNTLRSARVLDDNTIITVPVVFHIVHSNPASVPDKVILDALADLNDAFSRAGAYSGSKGVDTRIRFCLAKKDGDGGITTGITRIESFFANSLNPLIEDHRLKNLVQWDPARFINIWYISSMEMEVMAKFQCGDWLRMKAGGYATMPPGGGATDGIVVTAFGQMLAHEMGHYLGLYHTFEGLDCRNYDCTVDGDKVCDTPPELTLSSTCTLPDNSCGTDTLSGYKKDTLDIQSNFMDYGNGGCANMFTRGQAQRMRAVIGTVRSGLTDVPCTPPCTEKLTAVFTRNNPFPIQGQTVSFTNKTAGADRFEWLVNGTVVSTATDYSRLFAAQGKYKVTLKAYKGASCFASYTDYVIVNCGVTARFYTDRREIASKDPVLLDSLHFFNTSEGAASYRWLLTADNGAGVMVEQQVSTEKELSYVFRKPGQYFMRLIATNGACSDTTALYPMTIHDPTADAALYIANAECYGETKLLVSFYVCNFGYAKVPAGTPITFYDNDPRTAGAKKLGTTFYMPEAVAGFCCGYMYTHMIDVGYRGLNRLYGVVSDSGKAVPVRLPVTTLPERDYNNNIWSIFDFNFKVYPAPLSAVLEPGDTLQLNAGARGGWVSSWNW